MGLDMVGLISNGRLAWLWTVVVLALLWGCATVPLTERKALRLVPSSEIVGLGIQEYRKVLRKAKLSQDRAKVAMVRRVGRRIARAAEEFLVEEGLGHEVGNYQWEFNLIEDDKVVNAWCMPGGKVAVYTGILKFTKDEEGLAVVLGHEIAHAIAGHGNERMSQALLVHLGGLALSVALKTKPKETRKLFGALFGIGAMVGFILPYSRLQEAEADRIGLVLMARAGYDPRAAIGFWERMSKDSGPRPPQFLSTHPAPAARIEQIKRFIPEALPYFQRFKKKSVPIH